jgi:hypothetical protein
MKFLNDDVNRKIIICFVKKEIANAWNRKDVPYTFTRPNLPATASIVQPLVYDIGIH